MGKANSFSLFPFAGKLGSPVSLKVSRQCLEKGKKKRRRRRGREIGGRKSEERGRERERKRRISYSFFVEGDRVIIVSFHKGENGRKKIKWKIRGLGSGGEFESAANLDLRPRSADTAGTSVAMEGEGKRRGGTTEQRHAFLARPSVRCKTRGNVYVQSPVISATGALALVCERVVRT